MCNRKRDSKQAGIPCKDSTADAVAELSTTPKLPPGLALRSGQTKPCFIEIFSGSSNLSRHMYDRGFDVISVDWNRNKYVQRFSVIELDLSVAKGEDVLWELISATSPVAMHAGVPGGTSSRNTCRDADNPLGLPNISESTKHRVDMENRLYYLVLQLYMYCSLHNIIFSAEVPVRSWFWSVLPTYARQLSLEASRLLGRLFPTSFDVCMHGAVRQTRVRVDCTHSCYSVLAATCDNQHPHDHSFFHLHHGAQGTYPDLLCLRWAEALASALPSQPPAREHSGLKALTASLGLRQSKCLRQLVPEFCKVFNLDLAANALPERCKVLGPSLKGGEDMGLHRVGQFHSPEAFLVKARLLKHPLDTLNPVPDVIKRAIFNIYTLGAAEIAQRRVDMIRMILEWRQQLSQDEQALHASMPEYMQRVLEGKQILLLKRLLEYAGYDDLDCVKFLQQGVELSGYHDIPCYAESKITPATSTQTQLEAEAVWRRKALSTTQLDAEQFAVLEEQSEQEVAAGFLNGPFSTIDEVSAYMKRDDWVLNPRFLLLQGPSQKPRVIDDCKRSGLNETFTCLERLQLQDLDFVVAVAKLIRRCRQESSVTLELSDGVQLAGKVHPSLQGQQWLARALDLSKAYKQVAIAPSSRHLAVVGYPSPGSTWKYYASASLPFGASGSVYSFLRLARAIWFLTTFLFDIPACHYFDDFPHFEVEPLCKSSCHTFELFLKILGGASLKETRICHLTASLTF